MTNLSTNGSSAELKHIIAISPLGMLYGSAGPFLSPENLVGRSGDRFPPSSTTLAGIYGATQWKDFDSLNDLYIVGPFWAKRDAVQNFYVPTPLNFRVQYDADSESYQIVERWQWSEDQGWHLPSKTKEKKAASNTWVSIEHWPELQKFPQETTDRSLFIPVITINHPNHPTDPTKNIWQYHPHLHPRLEEDQRRVFLEKDSSSKEGSLFLENSVQLHPDYCLIYLSSRKLDNGWYRFGGESHLVEIECHDISEPLKQLFSQPVGQCFSLLTLAVWGTQRLSFRFPVPSGNQQSSADEENNENKKPELYLIPNGIQSPQETLVKSFWPLQALMTERPIPFRFRLGGNKNETKRLSRGRYGVPAGTVYQLHKPIPDALAWQDWPQNWFPRSFKPIKGNAKDYSCKHWGCGFALPL